MNKRLIISIFVSAYFIYYCLTFREWHFIDSANLIIHEAGHIVFIPFGKFMHILGGSLLQVLFPFIFTCYFFRREDYFSASLLLFWVGQNLLNVSVYASDAIVMQLPLLGGDSVNHDWNSLLSMTGSLSKAPTIGSGIYAIGIFIIICAIYFSFAVSLTKKAENSILDR